MGICASCLGFRSDDSHDRSETSRLLDSRNPQARYDGSASDELGYLDFDAVAQPERERQERDALTAIWKLTSDHLIDVTQGTGGPPGEQTHTTDAEFANLFHELFHRSRRRRTQSDDPNRTSTLQFERARSDEDGSEDEDAQEPVNEQEWLRDIILRDAGDGAWDCNRVHKIGRPLIINFDDSS